MVRVAIHSLPWGRLAAAAVLLGMLMEGVRRWPWFLWPLEGVAVGLLAAAVAWCLDEPAGAVVDAVPRPLWWRTVARAGGVAGLMGVWSVAVWWSRDGLFGHTEDVWVQGMAASLLGAAWATWRRSSGVCAPGITFAATVVPVAALWALARPFARTIPVFPYANKGYGDWTTSTIGWLVVAAVAPVCLVLVLSDSRWWRVGRVKSSRLRRQRGLWPQPRGHVLGRCPPTDARSSARTDSCAQLLPIMAPNLQKIVGVPALPRDPRLQRRSPGRAAPAEVGSELTQVPRPSPSPRRR